MMSGHWRDCSRCGRNWKPYGSGPAFDALTVCMFCDGGVDAINAAKAAGLRARVEEGVMPTGRYPNLFGQTIGMGAVASIQQAAMNDAYRITGMGLLDSYGNPLGAYAVPSAVEMQQAQARSMALYAAYTKSNSYLQMSPERQQLIDDQAKKFAAEAQKAVAQITPPPTKPTPMPSRALRTTRHDGGLRVPRGF